MFKPSLLLTSLTACLLCVSQNSLADADELQMQFSCSQKVRTDAEQVIFADIGEIHLRADQIVAFRWESSLHRATHGFDCSVDMEDGLQLERLKNGWRVRLADAAAARSKRGFDTERGRFCSIRVLREDATKVKLLPTCAVLCGSRVNFSTLTIDLRDQSCTYE